ncbi:MAG: hypothetical protein JWO92_2378 [Chitinophagaceae bacterium]|nr:hypothetical protein [Chitinophagaceae bacterium]
MIKLSERWVSKLLVQAETGMDYQIVSIILNDGRKFDQAIISGGNITKLRSYEVIPFLESDIEDIILTHDKWNWNNYIFNPPQTLIVCPVT